MGMFEQAARRRRAAEMERRLAELDEWDRLYGVGGVPRDTTWRYHSPEGQPPLRAFDQAPAPAARRRPRRRRGRWALALLLVVGLVAGAYLYPEQATVVRSWAGAAGRSVLGVPAAGSDGTSPAPGPDGTGGAPPQDLRGLGDTVRERLQDVVPVFEELPTGWAPATGERVLPPVDPGTSGPYAFISTQPDSGVPVGFSPCGAVEVTVNPDQAPQGYAELVEQSLARLTAASGLQLVLVGETEESWSEEARRAGSPVVVGWSDATAVPELAGTRAGMGGATVLTGRDGWSWAASGQVVLDVGDLPSIEAHAAVLDHELAHVLGLDHVDDPGELMAPVNLGRTSFGPGDLAGLAALGAVECP